MNTVAQIAGWLLATVGLLVWGLAIQARTQGVAALAVERLVDGGLLVGLGLLLATAASWSSRRDRPRTRRD